MTVDSTQYAVNLGEKFKIMKNIQNFIFCFLFTTKFESGYFLNALLYSGNASNAFLYSVFSTVVSYWETINFINSLNINSRNL